MKCGQIQRYIGNPLLLDGAKCDLRLYVVVTSYNPLRVYIHPEGLVRISTKKYKPAKKNSNSRTRFMHLTNYRWVLLHAGMMHAARPLLVWMLHGCTLRVWWSCSVNKRAASFVPNTHADNDGVGNKWSLSALWRHLAAQVRG